MDKNKRLKLLYKTLSEYNFLTKPELAAELGLSLTAISSYINELVESEWILPKEKADSRGGRRAVIYQPNPNKRYLIGLDLKASHFYIFIADLSGKILKSKIHYLKDYQFENYIQELKKIIKKLLAGLNLKAQKILAIGVSILAITDFENKVVERSNQLDWTAKPLAYFLESELKIPVFVETDVRVYAYNELEKDDPNNITAVLFIGEGIGLALIVANQILQGHTNRVGDNRFFGEKLKKLNEILSSNYYLQELNKLPSYAEEFEAEKIEELNNSFESFINKNSSDQRKINQFTDYIASMMISTINLLNPKKVLLTGNVFDYNNLIYQKVKNKISAAEMYYLPEIKRNKDSKNPLEKAIARFLIHKFWQLDKFKLTKN